MSTERCQRCGEMGEDRRTLSHACFYEMNELGLPFEEVAIKGVLLHKTGERELPAWSRPGHPLMVPVWEDGTETEGATWQFYWLRVCKRCRGDWLRAIQQWFADKPPAPYDDMDDGATYVRELGAAVRKPD